jgi:hypothetical protein
MPADLYKKKEDDLPDWIKALGWLIIGALCLLVLAVILRLILMVFGVNV